MLGVRQADGVGEVIPNVEGHPNVGFHVKTLKALPVGRRENSQRVLLKTHGSGSASKVSSFIFNVAFPGHALTISPFPDLRNNFLGKVTDINSHLIDNFGSAFCIVEFHVARTAQQSDFILLVIIVVPIQRKGSSIAIGTDSRNQFCFPGDNCSDPRCRNVKQLSDLTMSKARRFHCPDQFSPQICASGRSWPSPERIKA
jgi:hypothetical protein